MERERMPEISSAALKTLNNVPGNFKSSQLLDPGTSPITVSSMGTCKNCSKQYSKPEVNNIMLKLNIRYSNLCLSCIKAEIAASKSAKYPALRDLRHDLEEITLAYQSLYNKWKAASREYQCLDYQEQMIVHEQNKATKKPPTEKQPTEKQAKTNKEIAMKILANLSPEQQALVLASLKAQSSQNI